MIMEPKMTAAEVAAFIDKEFPQVNIGGRCYFVDSVQPAVAVIRLVAGDRHLRPGGTVSGPAMMELADLGSYVAILAHIGPVALAVTTNFTINFFRKPAPGDLTGRCRLLKLGKRLAVVECMIRSESSQEEVAQAVATYSIPAR